MADDSSTRNYLSQLRAEQAAATRQRIVEAAGTLFADRGFRGTTLVAIAAAAGVSVETVQAQGPKRQLLGAALQVTTTGREGEGLVFDAPEARGLVEAETPAQLAEAGADMMTTYNTRTAGLWRAFGSAAADDPAVDQEWSEVQAGIRSDVEAVVTLIAARGWLRTDVPRDETVASLWIVISAEIFEKLTVRLGWPVDRYREWLARAIADVALARDQVDLSPAVR
jgi:AcrR family transcriptional regulator